MLLMKLYRTNAYIGDGGTADILRYEFDSGSSLKHLQKAQDRTKQLNKMLNNPTLSESDRKLIYGLLDDLYNAIKYVKK